MSKELLFSLTKKDFEVQTFRAGGKGGQHQNKTDTGVRIIHRESGAVGEARDSRSQADNKKAAFNRLIKSNPFKRWHRLKCAELLKGISIEDEVNKQMAQENIKEEYYENGKWQEKENSSKENGNAT